MTSARFISPPRAKDIGWVSPPEVAESLSRDPAYHATGVYVEERCVAIGGVREIHAGSGEAFLLVDESYPLPPRVAIQMREFYQTQMATRFCRVQTVVDLYDGRAVRFNQWLGMRPEAILNQAGPDKETYVMFACIEGVDR